MLNSRLLKHYDFKNFSKNIHVNDYYQCFYELCLYYLEYNRTHASLIKLLHLMSFNY